MSKESEKTGFTSQKKRPVLCPGTGREMSSWTTYGVDVAVTSMDGVAVAVLWVVAVGETVCVLVTVEVGAGLTRLIGT